MILLISLLILVHEAGHFFVAKLFKMKVDKFGFGLPFGPTLYSKKFGDTEFLIHAFLLGGYVSFPDDDENSELPKDSPERFMNKPIRQRLAVVLAGVISNFLFAVLIVYLAGMIWGYLPSNSYQTSVAKILQTATPSTVVSGLQSEDIIYSINGSKDNLPIVMNKYLNASKSYDGTTDLRLVNKKETELLKINDISRGEYIRKGTTIKLPQFDAEQPVHFTYDELLGFEKVKKSENEINLDEKQLKIRNDIKNKKYYTVEDENISVKDIATAMSDTYKPLQIIVLRNGQQIKLNDIYPDENGMIGIEKKIKENMNKTRNPIKVMKNTSDYIYYNTSMMIYGLSKMIMGKVPVQEMHGIVAITKIGSDVIQYQGLFKGLLLTAIISLNLAIINLLPIPALDGGHVFFLLVEKMRGKPLNEKAMEVVGNLFFYLLVILMILIIFNDVFALVTKQI